MGGVALACFLVPELAFCGCTDFSETASRLGAVMGLPGSLALKLIS